MIYSEINLCRFFSARLDWCSARIFMVRERPRLDSGKFAAQPSSRYISGVMNGGINKYLAHCRITISRRSFAASAEYFSHPSFLICLPHSHSGIAIDTFRFPVRLRSLFAVLTSELIELESFGIGKNHVSSSRDLSRRQCRLQREEK